MAIDAKDLTLEEIEMRLRAHRSRSGNGMIKNVQPPYSGDDLRAMALDAHSPHCGCCGVPFPWCRTATDEQKAEVQKRCRQQLDDFKRLNSMKCTHRGTMGTGFVEPNAGRNIWTCLKCTESHPYEWEPK